MILKQQRKFYHRRCWNLVPVLVHSLLLLFVLLLTNAESTMTYNNSNEKMNTDTDACVTSLGSIYNNELYVANQSTFSNNAIGKTRTYVLCPNKIYKIDDDAQVAIRLIQSNVRIICGSEGKSNNNCTLYGGKNHLNVLIASTTNEDFVGSSLSSSSTSSYIGPLKIDFRGLTFESAKVNNILIDSNVPGTIQFDDCIFLNNRNENVIFAIYRSGENNTSITTSYENSTMAESGNGSNDNTTTEARSGNTNILSNQFIPKSIGEQTLEIIISNCIFVHNAYTPFYQENLNTSGGLLRLDTVSLKVYNTIFLDTVNDSPVTRFLYMIYLTRGKLTMFDNCFLGNDDMITPIVIDDADTNQIEKISNFNHRMTSNLPPETLCTFIAVSKGSSSIQSNYTESVTKQLKNESLRYTCINPGSIQCTASTYLSMLVSKTFQEPCLKSLSNIDEEEKANNAALATEINGIPNVRTYILCPETVYNINTWSDANNSVTDNLYHSTIQMRYSNVHILCGANGNSKNNCTIAGGHTQVHAESLQQDDTVKNLNKELKNILLLGITFTNASMRNILIGGQGTEVMIEDCIFQGNKNSVSIYTQYAEQVDGEIESYGFDTRRRRKLHANRSLSSSYHSDVYIMDDASKTLSSNGPIVTVSACSFINNTLGRRDRYESGLVTSRKSTLRLVDSIFIDNEVVNNIDNVDENYIVGNFYGTLEMNGNCFINNRFASVVISETFDIDTLPVITNRNGASNSDIVQRDINTLRLSKDSCDFLTKIVVNEPRRQVNSSCIAFDSFTCGVNYVHETKNVTTKSPRSNGQINVNEDGTPSASQCLLSIWIEILAVLFCTLYIIM